MRAEILSLGGKDRTGNCQFLLKHPADPIRGDRWGQKFCFWGAKAEREIMCIFYTMKHIALFKELLFVHIIKYAVYMPL